MPENERLKKVIFFLFSQGIVDSQTTLAITLGNNESYLSQVVTGLKPLSKKLIDKICLLEPNINPDYLLGVSDELLKVGQPKGLSYQGKEKVGAFDPTKDGEDKLVGGVPYYDIDITATLTESFSDIKEEPEFYVDFKPFNDCSAYLPVFGNSMHPMINSGEIVALKKVDNPEYIQYGEPHLIITNAETNNMRTLKIVRKHKDDSMIILKPINPDFDELAIPRNSILSLYIVKGKITRKQL